MFGLKNPFAREHDPDRPAPGGIDGQVVDYVRWYPPDTPFRWGQGFNHALTNVPAINGGRWPQDARFVIPDGHWQLPWGVDAVAYLWPATVGSDGRFQKQLDLAGTPATTGPPMATALNEFADAVSKRTAAITSLAGGFARS